VVIPPYWIKVTGFIWVKGVGVRVSMALVWGWVWGLVLIMVFTSVIDITMMAWAIGVLGRQK